MKFEMGLAPPAAKEMNAMKTNGLRNISALAKF
jgi:hypothetical protein